jgi:hypothetical protein
MMSDKLMSSKKDPVPIDRLTEALRRTKAYYG